MNLFWDQVKTFSRIQLGRHIRSPALWMIAIIGPILTRYIVPTQDSSYTVVSINGAFPVLNSSVIGMEIGIITAVMLSPLAYIFLRAGPTRTMPWQVEDVTPARRTSQSLGNWLADTAVLWLIMLCMAVSGIIISFFRLPLGEIRPHETLLTALFIGLPAFAVIASLRTLFASRPGLRGAWGDVLFFIAWMAGLSIAAITFMDGSIASPFIDVFGYAASIAGSTSDQIHSVSVGISSSAKGIIEIDALRGVMTASYIGSRLFWIGAAAMIAFCAGFIFEPRGVNKKRRGHAGTGKPSKLSVMAGSIVNGALPKSAKSSAPLWTNISQTLTPKILIFVVIGLAVAGAFLPFRAIIGPAILLVLIFPFTAHSARWQPQNLTGFTKTLPVGRAGQYGWMFLGLVLIASLACLPALARSLLTPSPSILPDLLMIIIILPLIATALGTLTRTAFAARFLLLLVWYMYLNAGVLG